MSGSGSEKLPARMEDLERQVAIYAKAAADIQTCQDIGEVKRGAMIGEALRKLAKAIKASAKTQNSLTVSTAWHKRREGELLAAMDKQHGARGVGKKVDSHDVGPLSALGISWNESRRSQDVAAVPIEEFHEWAEKASESNEPVYINEVTKKGRAYKRAQEKKDWAASDDFQATATVYKLDALEFLEQVEEVDLLLTDPPYSTDVEDIRAFALSWLNLALSRVKSTGRAYVFIGAYPEELYAYLDVIYRRRPGAMPHDMRLEAILPWVYRNTIGPGNAEYSLNWQACLYFVGRGAPKLKGESKVDRFAVQDYSAPDGRHGMRFHAWQKPDDLAEKFINQATETGQLVCDPFAGTGTFLAAAARLGRQAIGCEIDNPMLDICKQRGVNVGTERMVRSG